MNSCRTSFRTWEDKRKDSRREGRECRSTRRKRAREEETTASYHSYQRTSSEEAAEDRETIICLTSPPLTWLPSWSLLISSLLPPRTSFTRRSLSLSLSWTVCTSRTGTWRQRCRRTRRHWTRLRHPWSSTSRALWFSSWRTVLWQRRTTRNYWQLYSRWWSSRRKRYKMYRATEEGWDQIAGREANRMKKSRRQPKRA